MKTIRETLLSLGNRFVISGKDKGMARDFLMDVTHYEGANFFLRLDEQLTSNQEQQIEHYANRYLSGEPAQYILGYAYFYGERFLIDPSVLIPRSETEELVEWVLSEYDDTPRVVADIGCGSGIIAIILKKHRPSWVVYASDISPLALSITKKNADNIGVNLLLLEGNLLAPFVEQNISLDLIVSNPPYIGEEEIIDESVRNFEPPLALWAKEKGLINYRHILKEAPLVLSPKGNIYFEIGYNQAEAITNLVKQHTGTCLIRQDCYGKNRMAKIKIG